MHDWLDSWFARSHAQKVWTGTVHREGPCSCLFKTTLLCFVAKGHESTPGTRRAGCLRAGRLASALARCILNQIKRRKTHDGVLASVRTQHATAQRSSQTWRCIERRDAAERTSVICMAWLAQNYVWQLACSHWHTPPVNARPVFSPSHCRLTWPWAHKHTARAVQKVDEEEEDADNEFWQQDFFADGDADEDYSTESSDTDRADSDFDRAESSDDGEGDGNEERLRAVLKTKKAKDKPPGWKQAAQRRANLLRVKRLRDQSVKADAAPEASEGPSTSAGVQAAGLCCLVRAGTWQQRAECMHVMLFLGKRLPDGLTCGAVLQRRMPANPGSHRLRQCCGVVRTKSAKQTRCVARSQCHVGLLPRRRRSRRLHSPWCVISDLDP